MTALLLAAIAGLPLDALPAQALPPQGCAAYLFVGGEKRALVAMATPGLLRLSIDGGVVDAAARARTGAEQLGLAATTEYARDGMTATLDLTIEARRDLTDGAVVTASTLRLERAGKDGLVVPLAGLVGCRK